MAYIYKIENQINKKLYIGKTLYPIEHRWKQHQYNSTKKDFKNIPLYNAIKKYGLNNFSISIVEEVKDVNILSQRQKYWIKYFNTYQKGYNATLGGDGSLIYNYDEIWLLWKKGLSIKEISKKIKCNDFVVRTVLDHHNITTQERKERGYIDGNKQAKQAVEQLHIKTNQVLQEFSSLTEAAKMVHGDSSNISKVCRGKKQTYLGYKWRYKGSPIKPKDFSSKKINQIDLKTGKIIKTYNSISEAAKDIKGDASSLSKVCRGVQKTSKGYGWSYA